MSWGKGKHVAVWNEQKGQYDLYWKENADPKATTSTGKKVQPTMKYIDIGGGLKAEIYVEAAADEAESK